MRHLLLGLSLSAAFAPAAEPACAAHGTAVDFHDTPGLAAAAAKKEGKLVFVLHVSGDFEDPRFT
ncbi:MAG: hypothetical protein ACRC33_02855 [Gemmataceae bacterium]